MTKDHADVAEQVVEQEWVSFPGGELEGKRPKGLCPACRGALKQEVLCFQCYRADLDRERALLSAGELDTASDARFQSQLPFEPVNYPRLAMLKVERATARAAGVQGIGQHVDRRRQAQIAARHALQAIAEGLKTRQVTPVRQARALASAAHAAELQLPEAWMPFVVSR